MLKVVICSKYLNEIIDMQVLNCTRKQYNMAYYCREKNESPSTKQRRENILVS